MRHRVSNPFSRRGRTITPLRAFRFNRWELGGALGDLGTLLPLAAALITLNHMNATSVFFVVGMTYAITGFFYRLPMPVQPLKAVAAIAIASGLSASAVSASGLIMGIVLLFLAITGLIQPLSRLFPLPVVRGIQLGVGLFLIKAGLSLIFSQQVVFGGEEAFVGIAHVSVPVSLLLAIACGISLYFLLKNRHLPPALVMLAIGVVIGLVWGTAQGLNTVELGLSLPSFALPSPADLSNALLLLVIPQLPLTLANAVFATTNTAKTYFGDDARRVTPKALLTTMGLANLGAGLFGGVPICHGSGGMTAHHRFGARTGGAPLMIGGIFIALAVIVDGNVLPILSLIPYPVLGVLTVFIGVLHAMLARDMQKREDVAVVGLIALVSIITSNLAIGFASGTAMHLAFKAIHRYSPRAMAA